MKSFKKLNPGLRRRAQRGATMVSTTLLSVSLLSASMLLVRQATRNANESGAVVARERALLAAQGAAQLAAAYYRQEAEVDEFAIDNALAGSFPSGTESECIDIYRDCIPASGASADAPVTGQRNHSLTGKSDCAGRPCMRPGALVVKPLVGGAIGPWVRTPMSQLVQGGDNQAVVTVWVRNNMSEALGPEDQGTGSWVIDNDTSIVVTSMAEVHGAVVSIEQEFVLIANAGMKMWEMASPDLGYGGGHNNDSAAVETCSDSVIQMNTPAP